MRSRFAAYAKGLHAYIMDTTHPESPHARPDRAGWREELDRFTRTTRFSGLTILEVSPIEDDQGFVTFEADLRRDGQAVGFVERSRFVRVAGRWLYIDGVHQD